MEDDIRMKSRESQLQQKDAAFSGGCLAHEAMGSSGTRRSPMESQLQPNDAAFSVGNFHAREQPQLQPKDAAFSMKCLVRETLGSGARRRPLEPQLLQMNTSFSVGMEPLWQPKKAAFSVGQKQQIGEKKFENEMNQWDKRASSGVHDTSKEFGLMIREKLQEFAMILIKKYHYNFLVEYFDDYHGSFNKEEFLKMDKPKGKSRWQEGDSAAVIEKLEEEIILQEASTERLQGKFDGVPDQKFVGNGVTLGRENLIEGPAIYTDIGVGILPPILDLPEAKSGNTCNIYPRLGQDCGGPHAIKESPKYTAPLSLDPKKAESSLARVKIGIRQPPVRVLAGRLREIAEEVEDFAKGNKTPAAVLFFTSTSKSKLLSTAWKDELLAEIEVATAPNANAYKQPWYEYPRQICNLPLLHLKDAVDIFQCAVVVHHGGVGTTAVGIELEFYQLASIEVLGRITMGIDLGILRTKKKKPRRRKREK